MIEWRLSSVAIVKEQNYGERYTWTSISDVGRVYDGRIFTYNDYLTTEQSYVNLFISLFEYVHAKKIKLIHLSINKNYPPIATYDKSGMLKTWYNKVDDNMSLSIENLKFVVPLILRENMWGVLYHKQTKTHIRFGYDYYVYVRSPKLFHNNSEEIVFNNDFLEMVSNNGLYINYDKASYQHLVELGILNPDNDFGNKYFHLRM